MISVVVCTYNRSSTLERMLESFYGQDFSGTDHELIVVDNNSSDDTCAIAMRQSHHAGFRYVHEAEQGLSAARNRGVKEANGDVIAFLDDDVLLDRGWLQGMTRCYQETSASVVGGRAILLLEGTQPDWFGPFFRTLLSEVNFGPTRREIPDGIGLWGVNLSFSAPALRCVGGFNPRLGRRGGQLLGGEEMAVIERLVKEGALVVYEPNAQVQHIIGAERLQWDYFARLARANGVTREARESHRGPGWQLLRVARSSLTFAGLRVKSFLLRLARSGEYAHHRLAWQVLVEDSYRTQRWQRFRQGFARPIGDHARNA